MPEPTNAAGRSNSAKVVWLGCKLPSGITLELFASRPIEVDPARFWSDPRAFMPPAVKAKVTLRGANSCRNDYSVRGLLPLGYEYGITPVDAAFWDEWIKLNADKPYIRNGFVFMVHRERDAKAEARERESEKTGLEPLNPEIERDSRVNQDGLIKRQGVMADQDHLRKLQTLNGRD